MHVNEYKEDPAISYKRTDSVTLKTIMYPFSRALLPEKVAVDRVITAAHDVSRQLIKLKFDTLAGMGTSRIDTDVCVNYYSTMFTVNAGMSHSEALTAYETAKHEQEYPDRKRRIEKMGLKLI